jgi:Putative mono-oxygenase ydhR
MIEISGFSKKLFAVKMLFCRHVEYEAERKIMITAFVQFKLPQTITQEKAKELFSSTAPKYRDVQGLIRKYYLLSEDGGTVGGVYLWKSREHAEKLYTHDWRKFIKDTYGAEPTVEYSFTPVIVDNLTGEILKDD